MAETTSYHQGQHMHWNQVDEEHIATPWRYLNTDQKENGCNFKDVSPVLFQWLLEIWTLIILFQEGKQILWFTLPSEFTYHVEVGQSTESCPEHGARLDGFDP